MLDEWMGERAKDLSSDWAKWTVDRRPKRSGGGCFVSFRHHGPRASKILAADVCPSSVLLTRVRLLSFPPMCSPRRLQGISPSHTLRPPRALRILLPPSFAPAPVPALLLSCPTSPLMFHPVPNHLKPTPTSPRDDPRVPPTPGLGEHQR